MARILLRVARRLRHHAAPFRHRLFDPAPVRPIVCFHSDDWGRTGIPRAGVIDELRDLGYPVGTTPWDYYGLETDDDLVQLQDILQNHKDMDGRSAVMAAVFVVANADLPKMRLTGYRRFYPVSIIDGPPLPWNQPSLIDRYRGMIQQGVFYPALHGYTHFNPDLLCSLAQEAGERGNRIRALLDHDIPYLASLTPEFNFALLDRSRPIERFVQADAQHRWVVAGCEFFAAAFGRQPLSTCAPGYRCNEDSYRAWSSAGIKVVHGGNYLGLVSVAPDDTVFTIPRNTFFEPALDTEATTKALHQAERAVACGEPIVICTHSINYLSRFTGAAERGRVALRSLLNALLARWPDLRFADDSDLYNSWMSKYRDWWRSPQISEQSARLRRH